MITTFPQSNGQMPLAPTAATAVGAAKVPSMPAPNRPAGGQTILVVDDDDALRMTAAMMLECYGFKTLMASNGLEALQQMESNPRIGVVLLDLLMPVMDGEETFHQMRTFWGDIPVVLMSGLNPTEIVERLGNPAPDGFVPKPFNLAALTSALGRVLS